MSKVAPLKISIGTAIGDYNPLVHLADCENFLPKTDIKLNPPSWSLYYHGYSTPPWPLDGVFKTLRVDSYKSEMLAIYDIVDENIIPKIFVKSNIYHLSTVMTHSHTTTTGAMKEVFGSINPKYRHNAHKKIHDILVDLLAIQKEIYKGIFAVMVGYICGDGARGVRKISKEILKGRWTPCGSYQTIIFKPVAAYIYCG